MVFFRFLSLVVNRCTPLVQKSYLSLNSIGIVKRFKGSLKSMSLVRLIRNNLLNLKELQE